MLVFGVTYLKIPLQVRLYWQSMPRYAASYIEGFAVEKKLNFLDSGRINLLAELGHSSQNRWGSMMEFP
jgi:hypothetical protein